jgi:uncharacterized membrane protein YwzB
MLNRLIQIVVALVVAGVLLWALEQFPIDATIAKVIRVIVTVVVILYAVQILLAMAGHRFIF